MVKYVEELKQVVFTPSERLAAFNDPKADGKTKLKMSQPAPEVSTVERQRMDADIVCVGFGPATAGFLTTLSKQLVNADGTPAVESAVMPGMPPQVLCYERADDIGFGVSGVVTRARALRATFPGDRKGRHPDGRARRRGKSSLSARSARREPAFDNAARWRIHSFAPSNWRCRSSSTR